MPPLRLYPLRVKHDALAFPSSFPTSALALRADTRPRQTISDINEVLESVGLRRDSRLTIVLQFTSSTQHVRSKPWPSRRWTEAC